MANQKNQTASQPTPQTATPPASSPPTAPAPAPNRRKTDDEVELELRAYLTKASDTIAKFIRDKSSMTPLALVQAAGVAFRREPDKMRDERSWRTVVTALVVAAQYDLEPIGREGWLIPREAKRYNPQTRKKESLGFQEWSFMPSFQGLVKQALLSGLVRSIRAHVVYANEHCVIQLGDTPGVDHRPTWGDRGDPIGVYAIARMTDGSIEIEPMTWTDVERIRAAASEYSDAWNNWYDEMARKAVLKRFTKQLPAGRSFAALVQLDNAIESGRDDDRTAALEAALGEKIALLPPEHRGPLEQILDRAAGGRTRAAGSFAAKVAKSSDVVKSSEAQFAVAAVRVHEGAAVTRMADAEAKNPPPNVACDECKATVRAGGLDIDDKWDVYDGRVICSKCEPGEPEEPDATAGPGDSEPPY